MGFVGGAHADVRPGGSPDAPLVAGFRNPFSLRTTVSGKPAMPFSPDQLAFLPLLT